MAAAQRRGKGGTAQRKAPSTSTASTAASTSASTPSASAASAAASASTASPSPTTSAASAAAEMRQRGVLLNEDPGGFGAAAEVLEEMIGAGSGLESAHLGGWALV